MLRLIAIFGTILLCCGSSRADDAEKVFESLYGASIKKVSSTPDRADDVALAKELLSVAEESDQTPSLQAMLCRAAYDLGVRHPDGFSTSAQAMILLGESQPENRSDANEKLVEILTRQSRIGKAEEREAATASLVTTLVSMGDENLDLKQWSRAASDFRRALVIATSKKLPDAEKIKEKVEFASHRDQLFKQVARLEERILENANDSAAIDEVVKLYLLELDDMPSVTRHLARIKDEQLAKVARLTTASLDSLNAADCLMLGEWYKNAAATTKSPSNLTTLKRARLYLERFIANPSGSELDRRKAGILLNAVIAEGAPIATPPTPKPDTKPVVKGDVALTELLLSHNWRLDYFSPSAKRRRQVGWSFYEGGKMSDRTQPNWQIEDGILETFNDGKRMVNRWRYNLKDQRWEGENKDGSKPANPSYLIKGDKK